MEMTVIYTAITGGYDQLLQPCLPAEGFKFICFVSKGSRKNDYEGAWQIEEIEEDGPDRYQPTQLNSAY